MYGLRGHPVRSLGKHWTCAVYVQLTNIPIVVGLDVWRQGSHGWPAPPRSPGKGSLLGTSIALDGNPANKFDLGVGHLRHPCVDRCQGEHVRADGEQDTIRGLPGRVEHPAARLRARHHTHGTRGR